MRLALSLPNTNAAPYIRIGVKGTGTVTGSLLGIDYSLPTPNMAHKARTSTVVPSHDVIKEKKILSDIRAQVAESQQEYERSVQLKSDTTDLQNEHDRLCTEVAKRKSEIDSLKKKSEELEASHRDSEAKLATVNAHLDSQESVLKLRGDIENDLGRISGNFKKRRINRESP